METIQVGPPGTNVAVGIARDGAGRVSDHRFDSVYLVAE